MTDSHCPESEDGEHEPDKTSVIVSDAADDIYDVVCLKCGAGGSLVIFLEDINW
jgi:hypothetical protein